MNILFVCMGNICRSPSAQGVFEKLIKNKGLEGHFSIDSAATHAYHVGASSDSRAILAASKRGIDISGQKARQISLQDFVTFDYIVVMDEENLRHIHNLCPLKYQHKIHQMMDFVVSSDHKHIPDPYYGGNQGFDLVLDLLEQASLGLLQHIIKSKK